MLIVVIYRSTHLRSCTNAATHPEDAVKLFSILFHDWVVGYSSSVLKLYQFMNCPKTTHPDLPKLYQWPILLEKGRRSCYKLKLCHLLLISKGAQIVTHLSCWAVVIHNFKIECCTFIICCPNGLMPATALMVLGRVEVNEADFDSSLPAPICCWVWSAQFSNFKEALNLTDLTWSSFLATNQRTPFLKFRFLSTSYYL